MKSYRSSPNEWNNSRKIGYKRSWKTAFTFLTTGALIAFGPSVKHALLDTGKKRWGKIDYVLKDWGERCFEIPISRRKPGLPGLHGWQEISLTHFLLKLRDPQKISEV